MSNTTALLNLSTYKHQIIKMQKLLKISDHFECSESYVRTIVISEGQKYFPRTPDTPLNQSNKSTAVIFFAINL